MVALLFLRPRAEFLSDARHEMKTLPGRSRGLALRTLCGASHLPALAIDRWPLTGIDYLVEHAGEPIVFSRETFRQSSRSINSGKTCIKRGTVGLHDLSTPGHHGRDKIGFSTFGTQNRDVAPLERKSPAEDGDREVWRRKASRKSVI